MGWSNKAAGTIWQQHSLLAWMLLPYEGTSRSADEACFVETGLRG